MAHRTAITTLLFISVSIAHATFARGAAKPTVGFLKNDEVLLEHTQLTSSTIVAVTRTGPTESPLIVRFQFNPNRGYAQNGVDIERIPETITIPSGESSAQLELKVINDSEVKGQELINLILLSSEDYTLDLAAVMTNISLLDNDHWQWAPVTGDSLEPADVAQQKMLPGLDATLQESAWMLLSGSATATNNSVNAELHARVFDGGVISDTNAESTISYGIGFSFEPMTGDIYRSRLVGEGASISGMIPAELAVAHTIDNTRPDLHTATVNVVLVAAVRGDITVTGDKHFEIRQDNNRPRKPLRVAVRRTSPEGEYLSAKTKFTFKLVKIEDDSRHH